MLTPFTDCIKHTHIYIYINQIITEWKEEEIKGIKISRNKDIKRLWFVEDQFNVADSGDAIQISVHKLLTSTNKHGLKKFQQAKLKQWLVKEEVQWEVIL